MHVSLVHYWLRLKQQSREMSIFYFPFLFQYLYLCSICSTWYYKNTQQQGMCPPDKSSYLVSEVHIGSIPDQFLHNPYPPFPSSHHESCLKILHGIKKKILKNKNKKSLNTRPRACVPTYSKHVPGESVVTIMKRSRYRTTVSGSANAQQLIERKRKVMYPMYQSGDMVLIASARLYHGI